LSYLGELRQNARPLAAASLGVGSSIPFLAYANSIFAPHLLDAFHWSRSQFALYGLVAVTTIIALPFIGRFADRLGVKPMATVGTLLMPFVFLGYSQMQGSFGYYLFLSVMKLTIGHMTSAIVYTRLIAQYFDRARGLAMTIVVSTPAVLGAISAPILNSSIEHFGWRFSYLGLGAFTLLCGLIALALIPPRASDPSADAHQAQQPGAPPSMRKDFAMVSRSRVFWIVVVGMYLCLLTTPLHSSQLNILLLDNGLSTSAGAWVLSLYAVSTVVGRLVCGVALDHFPTPIVTAVCMFPPAVGFLILATDFDAVTLVAFAMILVGFTVGAEHDLLSYLVARYFKLRIFSSTLAVLTCFAFLATATGSIAISVTLDKADTFAPYLYVVSGTVLLGCLLFLFLPRSSSFPKVG
jgi:MFS family permease